ncbi:MAG: class I SAM-dependent methyltransferase [Dehalococcoidia bacterium]|nr:class I SAM-dependent methyltransferase [Dehalococcoidia bacterium]
MNGYDPEWYRSFFGQDYLDVYGHLLTEESSEVEADFVIQALGLEPGDRVLDLCCGTGRHAVPLARAGLKVTGLDMSEEYLDMAGSAAREAGVKVRLVCGDMREIPYEGEFDAVVNMFTAFGYFDDDADDQRVLDGAAAALRPGGRLLLDLLNRDWVAANYVRNESREGEDGTVYREMRTFDPVAGRNHVEFTITSPGGVERKTSHHIRLYVATEVSEMLRSAGLLLERVYGGFDGSRLSVEARRMILVAGRP